MWSEPTWPFENTVHHFRYHNTNCFFIGNLGSERLIAFDAGWPCTLYEYQRCMKDIGLRFAGIQLAVVSHFHMDHAGLVGEFPPLGQVMPDDRVSIGSWDAIIKAGAVKICPSHAGFFEI